MLTYELRLMTANGAIVHVISHAAQHVVIDRRGDRQCGDYVLTSRRPFAVKVVLDGLIICQLRAHSIGEQLSLGL